MERRWSVDVFDVFDQHHQQTILDAFRLAERPVTALGMQSDHYWFVIVETNCVEDRIHAWRTVKELDIHARKSYSSSRPRRPGLRLSSPEVPAG